MTETDQIIVLKDEVQLLGYGETDSGGPWIKLRLQEPGQLAPFRGQAKATPNKCGQRYALVLVEIGDDEMPVQQGQKTPSTGRNYAFQCVEIFEHDQFIEYMTNRHDIDVLMNNMEESALARWYHAENPFDELPGVLKEACIRQAKADIGIERKRELNQDDLALKRFQEFQRNFYHYVRVSQGGIDGTDIPANNW